MKQIIVLYSCLFQLLLGVQMSVSAQSVSEKETLDALYQAIQKTPSYQVQLKKDPSYAKLYTSLKEGKAADTDLQAFFKYYQLISPLSDNHLGMYKNVDSSQHAKPLYWLSSKEDLLRDLKAKSLSSVEGVYYIGKDEVGVVLDTQTMKQWPDINKNIYALVGLKDLQVYGYFIATPFGGYDFVQPVTKGDGIFLLRNRKYIDNSFPNLDMFKQRKPLYRYLKIENGNFEFKNLQQESRIREVPGIVYLRLSSFSAFPENIQNAKAFFAKYKDSLSNSKHIIVDVRNNNGGGYKTSQQFINFLSKYKGRVYILQNIMTGSNAEQFIIKLKDLPHVTLLGEVTTGTITYGSNFGKKIELPHTRFFFSPTDMKGNPKELPYETMGVKPDVSLDYFKQDWILQTLDYIQASRT